MWWSPLRASDCLVPITPPRRRHDGAVTAARHGGQVIEDHGQPPLVLVIAAWHDRRGLRARITFSCPDDAEGRTSVVVDGGEGVLDIVVQWLRRSGEELRDREC